MKFSVCLDAVYGGIAWQEALRRMHAIGYKNFEFWSWWDKDISEMIAMKESLDMQVAAFCTRMRSLTDAKQRIAYKEGLEESMIIAKQLRCKQLITQVGQDTGEAREKQFESIITGLKECVPLLEAHQMTLLVEPLNIRFDHPGYFLSHTQEAFALVEAVTSPNVKILFDLYHQQITEGDVLRNSLAHLDYIGHFHAAANPGRGPLHTGELNYDIIFDAIEQAGYKGFMGLEYFTADPPEAALKRLKGV